MNRWRLVLGVVTVSSLCVLLHAPWVHAADPTPNAPVTVTVVDPVYNPIGGGVLNGADDATCRDIAFSFNAVIFVKYVRPDGSLIGYSNNFDMSVEAINPSPDASDQGGKAWQERWNKDKSQTLFQEETLRGPGPVDLSVRRSGTTQLQGQGNACVSPTEPQAGQVGAYAFRNGTDKAPYHNNGSFGLASINQGKYSSGFTFTMKGDPKDVPIGKKGTWRQASYIQKPFGETQTNGLNRRYMAIEFKYELEDAPTQDFNLVPKVTASPTIAEQADSVTYTYTMNNTATNSPDTQWATASVHVKAGTDIAPALNYPGGYRDSGIGSIEAVVDSVIESLGGKDKATRGDDIRIGSGTFPGSAIVPDSAIIPNDAPIGDKYCRLLIVVQPTAKPEPKYRLTPLACATVGVKPSIQVNGGDVSVGRAFAGDVNALADNESMIVTNTSMSEGKTFGSWGEYAASAPGRIVGFGTQSGLAKGAAFPDPFSWNGLTLSNTSVGGEFGRFASSSGLGTIPDIASVVRSLSPSPQAFNATLGKEPARGSYVYKPEADITIDQSSIPAGHSIFVYAPDHVITIKGNITYTSDELKQVGDIPQVLLIADRIKIDPSVGQVDAWLIAPGKQGVIDTCGVSDDIKTPLSTKECNQQLTINGPVMAHQLWLRRTARTITTGENGDRTPAELINLRPDVYLWADNQPGAEKRLLTTYSKELAPRF